MNRFLFSLLSVASSLFVASCLPGVPPLDGTDGGSETHVTDASGDRAEKVEGSQGSDEGGGTVFVSCSISNGGCDPNATCTSTGSSRTCTCKTGYSGTGTVCAATDSCDIDHGGCDPNATCTSTDAGKNSCTCVSGYAGNGMTCTGVGACAANNGGCAATARCASNGGVATCTCNTGYAGDGTVCSAVDSCSSNNGGCDANAACASTGPGTNTCVCNTGYSGNGTTCTGVNNCLVDNGGCDTNATCVSTGAATNTCTCTTGYSGTGEVCTAINLCLTNNGNCPTGETCAMTGPGTASCTCPTSGLWYPDCDQDGYGNSAATPVHSCAQPPGSPTCPSGFTGVYTLNTQDCCDTDPNAFPSQTSYYITPTACGSTTQTSAPYDYNCDGVNEQQSNGPTNCTSFTCELNPSDQVGCIVAGSLPADCNGNTNSFNTAACGQFWFIEAVTCEEGSVAFTCTQETSNINGGTQGCH